MYFIASIACLLATSIEQLIAARSCRRSVPVPGRCSAGPSSAMLGPVEAARALAYVGGAMALALLVGLALGGVLTVSFGWQAKLRVAGRVLRAIAAVWLWLGRKPSQIRRQRSSTDVPEFCGFPEPTAAISATCWRWVLSYSALFAFIPARPFVLIGCHGLSPTAFGLLRPSSSPAASPGTQIAGDCAAWLVRRLAGPCGCARLGGRTWRPFWR